VPSVGVQERLFFAGGPSSTPVTGGLSMSAALRTLSDLARGKRRHERARNEERRRWHAAGGICSQKARSVE
jgi:hypothetical protein